MSARELTVIQLGNPNLRRTSVAISDLSDPDFQSFLDSLVQTCFDHGGVGIAAAQVDVPQRVFIMYSQANERYPDAPDMTATVVINPKITWASVETEKEWEGCLSLPGIRGLVARHKTIKVTYLSRSGETVETEYSDFIARVFQHEIDHLDGIVFLDRVTNTRDIMMEQEWQNRFTRTDN